MTFSEGSIMLSSYPRAVGSVGEAQGKKSGLQQGPWLHCVTQWRGVPALFQLVGVSNREGQD